MTCDKNNIGSAKSIINISSDEVERGGMRIDHIVLYVKDLEAAPEQWGMDITRAASLR